MLYWWLQGQMFVTGETMRAGRTVQPLSYDVRLPDEAQTDALRLLDASRAVVNALLICLWPQLDECMGERSFPAGKHRKQISEGIHALQKEQADDETALVSLHKVVEQACHHFLQHGRFPAC